MVRGNAARCHIWLIDIRRPMYICLASAQARTGVPNRNMMWSRVHPHDLPQVFRRQGDFMYHVILGLVVSTLAIHTAAIEAKAIEVYLFKGAGDFSFINENAHFSRGLDRIADQLSAEGIHAEVRRHGATEDALRTIRQRQPESVAFVGHSMGAIASMRMARKMRSEGIKVAYVATLDIPGPIGVAGSNVEWAENYYSMTPAFGLLTNVRKHPKAENIYVFAIHASMDDTKKVRNGVLAAIRQVHAAEQDIASILAETSPTAMPAGGLVDSNSAIVPEAHATPLW